MSNLDLSEVKSEQMDKLETTAMSVIQDVLEEKREVDDVAQAAIKTMSMVAKNRQTQTARMGLSWNIAATIGDDEALKKYVEITTPKIKKALAGKVA